MENAELNWTDGIPSIGEVAQWKFWLVFDPTQADDGPQVVRLNVQDGAVMLQNGHAFYQRLDDCRWAQRSRYTPISRDGTPVRWCER